MVRITTEKFYKFFIISVLVILLVLGNDRGSSVTLPNDHRIWTETQVISIQNDGMSIKSSVVIDSKDNVHIVWADSSNHNGALTDIFYSIFDAASKSWSITTVIFTESLGSSVVPKLAVDSADTIHMVWQDMINPVDASDWDIFYKYRNPTNGIWSTTQTVSTESNNTSLGPSLAIDKQNNVHVVWADAIDYLGSGIDIDIFYRYLNTTSSVWSNYTLISPESDSFSTSPDIAIDSMGNIHIIWQEGANIFSSGIDFDIFYKIYNQTTGSWDSPSLLSIGSNSDSRSPSLGLDYNDNVYVVWDEYKLNNQFINAIYLTFKNSTTGLWMAIQRFASFSISNSVNPSLIVDSRGSIHVVWSEGMGFLNPDTVNNIYYKTWTAYEPSGAIPELVSFENAALSSDPVVAIDSQNTIYVVWSDTIDYQGAGTDSDIMVRTLVDENLLNTTVTETNRITEYVTQIVTETETTTRTDRLNNTSIVTSEKSSVLTETSIVTSTRSLNWKLLPILNAIGFKIIIGKRSKTNKHNL